MRILIVGSSGLVGTALLNYLEDKGHRVRRLVRAKVSVNDTTIFWDPYGKTIDIKDLEGYDAVINLSGENIASSRWTDAKKKKIIESRVGLTHYLSELLSNLENPPKTLINASAIGYYGDTGFQSVTEESQKGEGFLSRVCDEWESATGPAIEKGIRVVTLRIGMVLSPHGGALTKMLTPFKLGLGGVLGSGKQYISWISIEDLVCLIEYCLNNTSLSGPINAVTPKPVTNQEFTKTLGMLLNRPTFMAVPSFAVKLLFGEMGKELLLASSWVVPHKLIGSDYQFLYPELKPYLSTILR